MRKTIDIIIADDHPIFRAGLKQLLESEDFISVTGEADNGLEALSMIKELAPDVAILDIRMPLKSGLQILDDLSETKLHTKVILLTSFRNVTYFFNAISRGAKGYVLKNEALDNIIDAVKQTTSGGQFLSKELSKTLHANKSSPEQVQYISNSLKYLTPSEREVLQLISEWKTNKEIAELLEISPRTVGNHRTNISSKLNISGPNGLVEFAIENKDLL